MSIIRRKSGLHVTQSPDEPMTPDQLESARAWLTAMLAVQPSHTRRPFLDLAGLIAQLCPRLTFRMHPLARMVLVPLRSDHDWRGVPPRRVCVPCLARMSDRSV